MAVSCLQSPPQTTGVARSRARRIKAIREVVKADIDTPGPEVHTSVLIAAHADLTQAVK
jgi:hypothetical protein